MISGGTIDQNVALTKRFGAKYPQDFKCPKLLTLSESELKNEIGDRGSQICACWEHDQI